MKTIYDKAFDETPCPHCGKLLDSSTNADDGDRGPQPGDPSICNRCAGIAVFMPDMSLALPDRETLEEWKSDPDCWAAIDRAVDTVMQRGPR